VALSERNIHKVNVKIETKGKAKSKGKVKEQSIGLDDGKVVGKRSSLDEDKVKSLDRAKGLAKDLAKDIDRGLVKDDRLENDKDSVLVSSVVKITRDMITRTKRESNSTTYSSSSIANTQNNVVPKKVNTDLNESESNSVVKVTRGMIRR